MFELQIITHKMSKKDKIVIICPHPRFTISWVEALREKAPDFEIEAYPDDTNREETEFVMTFNPPDDVFDKYPNLKVVASMGAGVRSIIGCPSLPKGVQVTKIVQKEHQEDMAQFVLALSLSHIRQLPLYRQYQSQELWKPRSYKRTDETTVGIMGLGAIGQVIGKLLVKNGFRVTGWSKSKKEVEGIKSFYGQDQRKDFLNTAEILVCILPLTPETHGILNREVFADLPKGAYLINIGRGAQLNEQDLLDALQDEQLSGATLDVFETEPLPKGHPFWQHDQIRITPHIAGNSHPKLAAVDVLANYQAMKKGTQLIHTIDLNKGY